MRRHVIAVATSVALASCYGADRFEDQLFDAQCDWYTACYPDAYTSRDQCQRTDLESEGCEFDADKAHDCVDAWDALTCEEPTFPDVCDSVYKCPVHDTDL